MAVRYNEECNVHGEVFYLEQIGFIEATATRKLGGPLRRCLQGLSVRFVASNKGKVNDDVI